MKQILLSIAILTAICNLTQAQDRLIARGATSGELYLTTEWYEQYYSEELRLMVSHLTENGKKLTIQYDADYFADNYTEPGSVMQPNYILADATPGVIYCKRVYDKNYYYHTQLWVSFDYGENWIFREEDMGSCPYFSGVKEGNIYRKGGGMHKSIDYGSTWEHLENTGGMENGDIGFEDCEFFGIYVRTLYYTFNCFQTYIMIDLDPEVVYGQVGGNFPDVFRGGLQGEVYVTSKFPDQSYKASVSADTGHTFRVVYHSANYNYQYSEEEYFNGYGFMSDREPGVFYILRFAIHQHSQPAPGQHLHVYVDYYRDYGETLEATFFHDLTMNYEYEEVMCNHITSLEANTNLNSVQLQWSNSADNIRGYHVYRNNTRITSTLLTEATYFDENLPDGNYEYYVRTYYTIGCVSDSSNHVTERIELGVKGVKELEGVSLFPNPTTGELRVTSYELRIMDVEVFDVYGRKLSSHHLITSSSHHLINISHLQAGIYFVKIQTEKGDITKKIIKY
jgi:hypothetical protein